MKNPRPDRSPGYADRNALANILWGVDTWLWEMGIFREKPDLPDGRTPYVPLLKTIDSLIPGCRCRDCKFAKLNAEAELLACDNPASPVNFINLPDFGCILGERKDGTQ